MPYYESPELFGAIGDAREKAQAAPDDLREGVQELLTIAIMAKIVPDRLDRLTDVSVDCAPDVRPVISSLIASLLARPRDQQRRILYEARNLLDDPIETINTAGEPDAFSGFTFETFKE
jgi:hypothetical protein